MERSGLYFDLSNPIPESLVTGDLLRERLARRACVVGIDLRFDWRLLAMIGTSSYGNLNEKLEEGSKSGWPLGGSAGGHGVGLGT